MSEPSRLLDCQSEHAYEPADPHDECGMTFWIDEYSEEHPRVRRWHAARGFALAALEAGVLWGVVLVILALFYFVFG